MLSLWTILSKNNIPVVAQFLYSHDMYPYDNSLFQKKKKKSSFVVPIYDLKRVAKNQLKSVSVVDFQHFSREAGLTITLTPTIQLYLTLQKTGNQSQVPLVEH